jgi:hypothetical protein
VNLAFIVFLKGRFARRREKGKDSFILLFTGAALSDMTLNRLCNAGRSSAEIKCISGPKSRGAFQSCVVA